MNIPRAPWALSLIIAAPLLLATRTAGQSPTRQGEAPPGKPRVVITADPELDDVNTLIRALLYSTDFTIEGLVYASSGFHWKGDGQGTTLRVPGREYTRFGLNLCPCTSWRWAPNEHFIDDVVGAYAKVYPNLEVHSGNYPSPALLASKIRWGNVEFDGDYSKDTPGSDLIKALLLDDRPGPLFVTAQGGQSTIARALKSIADQYSSAPDWPALRQRVSRKLVIVPSGDQDGTGASYIKPNWPDVETWQLATVNFGYGVRNALSTDNAVYVGAEWTRTNVSSRGPLGAMYRVWGDGKQMVKGDVFDYFGLSGLTAEQLKSQGYIVWTPPQEKGSFIGEGDTPTFMNFLDNGLRAYEDGTHGGWAGPRFFAAAQHDFAARLKWSVTPTYKDANHEPQVTIIGPLARSARAGETIRLRGAVTDPDRDSVIARWWHFREAGTYPGEIVIRNAAGLDTAFQIPNDAQPGQTMHVILEATDAGTPSLTRYQRVIVTAR